MNAGILRKAVRDNLRPLIAVAAGIVLLETLIVGASRELARDIHVVLDRLPFVRRLAGMLVGADLGDEITAMTFVAFGFVHPVLLALTWAFLLTVCTRVPAGEIDRGTADLLLTLPVTRTGALVSTSAAWVLCGVPVCLAPLLGVWLGRRLFPSGDPVFYPRLLLLCVNLFALYLAVGGAATMASSWSSRRGTAVAVVLALLLGSFLLTFLAQYWEAVENLAFLSILRYYRPLPAVRTGRIDARDVGVLLALAGLTWSLAWWRFARRDVPAV